jgi:hypothetical protein
MVAEAMDFVRRAQAQQCHGRATCNLMRTLRCWDFARLLSNAAMIARRCLGSSAGKFTRRWRCPAHVTTESNWGPQLLVAACRNVLLPDGSKDISTPFEALR